MIASLAGSLLLGCSPHAFVGLNTSPAQRKVSGSVERVAKDAARSVVAIETDVGQGMGFVIDEAGYVVTSRHVVEEVGHVNAVRWPGLAGDHRARSVQIVYIDPVHDLALLKVDAPGERFKAIPLTAAAAGQAPAQAAGDPVVLTTRLDDPSLTLGAERGVVTDPAVMNEAVGPGPYVGVTNSIQRGQSGGPVLDLHGRAVGVVTWMWKDKPGGFAVPASRVVEMLRSRPSLNTLGEHRARVRIRMEGFSSALQTEGKTADPRRFIAPSSARQVRQRTVDLLLDRISPEGMENFAEMLDQLALGAAMDPGVALERLYGLISRALTDETIASMGLRGALPRAQVVTFFLELGKAYLSARIYGAHGRESALDIARRRLHTLDSARIFLMADFIDATKGLDGDIEEITVSPGAYGPRAVVRLSPQRRLGRVFESSVYVQLALEWGDWYIVDVHHQETKTRGRVAAAQNATPTWRVEASQAADW